MAGPVFPTGKASRQGWLVSHLSRGDFMARLAALVPKPRVIVSS